MRQMDCQVLLASLEANLRHDFGDPESGHLKSFRCAQMWKRTTGRRSPAAHPTLTDCMRSVLFPVHCGLSVLRRVLLRSSCWRCRGCCCGCCRCCCRCRGTGLLLSELLPERLLPGLHHVGHHRVDQGQGLYGAAVKHRAILGKQAGQAVSALGAGGKGTKGG